MKLVVIFAFLTLIMLIIRERYKEGIMILKHDYSKIDHGHDDYSLSGHGHANYSEVDHGHDANYADISHKHSDYAQMSHDHDYSLPGHTHDPVPYEHQHPYSLTDHTHNLYAVKEHEHEHNHNNNYAKIVHNHDDMSSRINELSNRLAALESAQAAMSENVVVTTPEVVEEVAENLRRRYRRR